jgi:2-polyprenyl-3-methyl-5-hydroxy-6-metoxy-1,4-benzoquinol methylase
MIVETSSGKQSNETEYAKRCPICASSDLRPWRWEGMEACVGCGHIIRIGTEGEAECSQLHHFGAEFALQSDIFTRLYERLTAKRRLRDLIRIPPRGRVLEIGVGRGSLLVALKAAGYRVEGLDQSSVVCGLVGRRHDIPVHCATLQEYANASPGARFDAVVMCHVLEHMGDIRSALAAVQRLIKPHGFLYIAVPNVRAWNAFLNGWSGYQPYHFHYFHASTLERVLKNAGFEVDGERTFEPISGWFNAIAGTIRIGRGGIRSGFGPRRDRDRVPGAVRALYNFLRLSVGLFLSPLRWAQSACGRGEELIVVARAAKPRETTDNALRLYGGLSE